MHRLIRKANDVDHEVEASKKEQHKPDSILAESQHTESFRSMRLTMVKNGMCEHSTALGWMSADVFMSRKSKETCGFNLISQELRTSFQRSGSRVQCVTVFRSRSILLFWLRHSHRFYTTFPDPTTSALNLIHLWMQTTTTAYNYESRLNAVKPMYLFMYAFIYFSPWRAESQKCETLWLYLR